MRSQKFGTREINCTFGDIPNGEQSDLALDESLDLLFCGAELKESMGQSEDAFSVHDGSGKGPGNLLAFDFD